MNDLSLLSVWRNPIHFIACGFGVGTLPKMPGTFGTLLGVVLYLILAKLPLFIYVIVTFLLLLAGVYLCGKVNQDFGTKDHPAAVWDEVASFPLVMIAVPPRWYFLVIGFILFRIFDILKPGPIRWIDKTVEGGWGVMLDDVVAASFSWVIVYVISLIIR